MIISFYEIYKDINTKKDIDDINIHQDDIQLHHHTQEHQHKDHKSINNNTSEIEMKYL